MKKAVFFDRDGVINKEIGDYVYEIEKFELNGSVIRVMQAAIARNYLLFIITNQSGIAKGIYGHEQVEKVHKHMNKLFQDNEIHISGVYYCPHHPDFSECLCRKPGSLMLEKAVARFGLDVSKSLLIGDRDRDIEAAENIGIRGVKIDSNGPLDLLIPFLKG